MVKVLLSLNTSMKGGHSVATPGAFFGLMAAEGVPLLFEKLGFKRRPEGMPGMSLWVGA